MDCPSCGRANASDRLECRFCEALLVDLFEPNDQKTDPMVGIAATPGDEASAFARVSLKPSSPQYTGDLPRLFRFGDRYQVLEKLGEGGMGRVYKALDLELDRPVALKTIRNEKEAEPEVLKRFKQELVLARKITHKNVVRIYDLGEAEGMKFITMELVEGVTLRELQTKRAMIPLRESISYLKQMLAGLGEAHRQGVVHRDLKPQNVMVDGEGVLRIMDFGIARATDTGTLTATGELIGTPDYLSPEQVQGEKATAASDLFAVGVILYELLTGVVPFQGDTPIARIVARVREKPTPAKNLRPEMPAYLDRIVLKLIEADPDLRYQSADEVLADLAREQVDRSIVLRAAKAFSRHRRGLAAAALGTAIGLGVWFYRSGADSAAPADAPTTTLAILPFHNVAGGAELAWMSSGIPEMLATDVSQWVSLRPLLPERVHHVLDELGQQGQTTFDERTLDVFSEISRAEYSLHGRFLESGGILRFDLTLREATTGVVTPIKVEGNSAEVFSLVDAITERVADELRLGSFLETNRPIAELSTSSLDAFRAYQVGISDLRNGRNQSGASALARSVELDPEFAMAHARLAEAYTNLGENALAKASIEIATALAADKALAAVERFQIHGIAARIDEDPERAVEAYKRLTELFPDDPDVRLGLARALEDKGEVASSLENYRAVLDVNPSYGAALLGMGRMLVTGDRFDEALPFLERAADSGQFEQDLESLSMLHAILGVVYRNTNDHARAIEHHQKALAARRSTSDRLGEINSLVNLAVSLARLKRFEEATRSLGDAVERAREASLPSAESFALLNLGNVALERGNLAEALGYYRDSLDIEWELNQDLEIAFRLDAMAEVYRLRGEYVEALVYLEQARSRLDGADDSSERAFNASVLGQIQRARGQYDKATQSLLLAIPPLEKASRYRDAAVARQALAGIYAEQGRFDEATSIVQQGVETLRAEGGANLAILHLQRAELLLERQDRVAAESELESVIALVPELSFEGRAQYHYVLGELLAPERPADAVKHLALAMNEARERDRRLAGVAAVALGGGFVRSGRLAEGRTLLESSLAEAKSLQHRPVEAAALVALSELDENTASAEERLLQAERLARSFSGRVLLVRIYRHLERLAEARGDSLAVSRAAKERAALADWVEDAADRD